MNGGYGMASPERHVQTARQEPVRYLVVIDTGGVRIARLLLATREQVGEFDASTEEITRMTQGMVPKLGALDAEWDKPLAGHSALERSAAEVYTLDV